MVGHNIFLTRNLDLAFENVDINNLSKDVNKLPMSFYINRFMFCYHLHLFQKFAIDVRLAFLCCVNCISQTLVLDKICWILFLKILKCFVYIWMLTFSSHSSPLHTDATLWPMYRVWLSKWVCFFHDFVLITVNLINNINHFRKFQ